MKYYKLVNDVPMFKKGDLFFIHPEEGCLLQKDTLRLAYHKKTLEKNPEILKEWFEVVPEECKRRRAEYGKRYWYVSDGNYIFRVIEDGHDVDNYRFLIGNYFKTAKEVDNYRKYLIARQVLLDDAEGGKFIRDKDNWAGVYSETYKEWNVSYFYQYRPGTICFKDEDSLKKSLKEHEEQWEIVRKYEMGK
jgi:hypothetical protein